MHAHKESIARATHRKERNVIGTREITKIELMSGFEGKSVSELTTEPTTVGFYGAEKINKWNNDWNGILSAVLNFFFNGIFLLAERAPRKKKYV